MAVHAALSSPCRRRCSRWSLSRDASFVGEPFVVINGAPDFCNSTDHARAQHDLTRTAGRARMMVNDGIMAGHLSVSARRESVRDRVHCVLRAVWHWRRARDKAAWIVRARARCPRRGSCVARCETDTHSHGGGGGDGRGEGLALMPCGWNL
jgi:hypothetical protein